MKIKELVKKLKKVSGIIPVRFLTREGKIEYLLRDFNLEDSDWELLEIGIGSDEYNELDTEFLKHILDYGNKVKYVSYFGWESPFDEYEIEIVRELLTSSRVWRIGDAYIRNIDGKTCFILEEGDNA